MWGIIRQVLLKVDTKKTEELQPVLFLVVNPLKEKWAIITGISGRTGEEDAKKVMRILEAVQKTNYIIKNFISVEESEKEGLEEIIKDLISKVNKKDPKIAFQMILDQYLQPGELSTGEPIINDLDKTILRKSSIPYLRILKDEIDTILKEKEDEK